MPAAQRAANVWPSEFTQATPIDTPASAPSGIGDHDGGRRKLHMTGRITRAVDFERVLKTDSQARSPHFAVHHLASVPSAAGKPAVKRDGAQLSTSVAGEPVRPVDDPEAGQPDKSLTQGVWLGMVIPKRHAKRAVTRTLLKRQIKAVMELQQPSPPGLWVVRLRAPFDRTVYVSAASKVLSAVAREELIRVMSSAALRLLAV